MVYRYLKLPLLELKALENRPRSLGTVGVSTVGVSTVGVSTVGVSSARLIYSVFARAEAIVQ